MELTIHKALQHINAAREHFNKILSKEVKQISGPEKLLLECEIRQQEIIYTTRERN